MAHNGVAADLFRHHTSNHWHSLKGETMQKRIALLTFAIFTLTLFAAAQASPPASASCDLGGGKTIKTDYSSPSAKGLQIYEGHVPFGDVSLTGANSATTFVNSSDINVSSKVVPAVSSTIFAVT